LTINGKDLEVASVPRRLPVLYGIAFRPSNNYTFH
jgi:hypothetical protein